MHLVTHGYFQSRDENGGHTANSVKSVKTVIYFMQRIDFRKLYDLRRLMFMSKLRYLQHDVIANLLPLSLTTDDVNDLFCTYDVTMYSTQCCIKTRVFSAFENCIVGAV